MKYALLLLLWGCTELDPLYCASSCANPTELCDLRTHTCRPRGDGGVQCTSASQCLDPSRPICSGGKCVSCGHNDGGTDDCAVSHPTRPLCAQSGACLECFSASDCAARHFACQSDGNCGACSAHSECTSGYCSQGFCGDPAELIYVNAAAKNCPGSGTVGAPFCTFQSGLDAGAATKKVVVVATGSYMENLKVQNPAGDFIVTLVGLGQPVLTANLINQPVLLLSSDGSHKISLSLDGFVIENAVGANGHGIQCKSLGDPATTRIKLIRSTVRKNLQHGVDSNSCELEFDADTIGPGNAQGGLLLQSSNFVITNTLVARNGGSDATFGGLYISSHGSGATVLLNNTVAYNQAKANATASGLHCLQAPLVANSVWFGNSGAAAEVSGSCQLDHCAYSGASQNGNLNLSGCMADMTFKAASSDDYHLVNHSVNCTLVGRGVPSSQGTSAPLADHDGRPRPGKSGYSIGAFEY